MASNGSAAAAAMMSQQWAAIKMDGLRDDGLQRRLAADSLSRSLACCRRDLLTHCVVREPYPDEGQRPRRVAAPASLKTHFSGTTLEMACEVRHEFLELPAFLRFPSFQGQPGVHWLHQHGSVGPREAVPWAVHCFVLCLRTDRDGGCQFRASA